MWWLALAACTDEATDDGGTDPVDTAPPPSDSAPPIGTDDPGPDLTTTGGAEGCIVLSGANDRVRGPDEGLPTGRGARTLQAWVRTRALREQVALSYGRPSPGQGFYLGTVDGQPMVRAGAGFEKVVFGDFVADDTWHHLVASWDGSLVVMVVDGALVGTGRITADTLEGDVTAGNTPTGDLRFPWYGWLDDVKILSAVRDPDDVARDPEGERTVDPADLELWWDFEGLAAATGPGVPVADLSGHGRDGETGGSADGTPSFPACR